MHQSLTDMQVYFNIILQKDWTLSSFIFTIPTVLPIGFFEEWKLTPHSNKQPIPPKKLCQHHNK